jgi:hypothetical protein
MVARPDWYRERATDARRRAAQAREPTIKSAYESMARDWAALAEQAEWIGEQRRGRREQKE